MKKGNLLLLVLSAVLFIIMLIPFFQNLQFASMVFFYSKTMVPFTSVYMPFLVFGMLEGSLITLYIISLFRDIRRQDATKFDLKN